MFRADDAPRYTREFIAHLVVYGVQLAVTVLLRIRMMRQNVLKRRAQGLLLSQTISGYVIKSLGMSWLQVFTIAK